MRALWVRFFLLCASATLVVVAFSSEIQAPKIDSSATEYPMTTENRVHSPGWWPTKGTAAKEEFVGEAVCAKCHSNEAASWASTPMAHASMLAKDSPILQQFLTLSSQAGPYSYNISNAGDKWNFSVTDGKNSITEPMIWAFGFNHKGQAYLLERNGAIYDTRLSFYNALQGLDTATGHPEGTPSNLEAALGRRMPTDETTHCFGCHTTASTTSNHFDPYQSTLGVTCEACHGPGAKHVAAMKSGKIEQGRHAIFNPASLGPVASLDFCGACHRTWGDVLDAGTTGVRNVRFQPYRLERSRCWGNGDARLKCVTCHNPHEPIVRDAASYDAKCLACHVTRGVKTSPDHPGKSCPVGVKGCVTCHMPPAEIPSMHAPFTDHRIRIARKGEIFPD
jgi:hypothetical protein